jgi:TetR/AcrR family transcriptional regulator, repressor for neighboring sulfatase
VKAEDTRALLLEATVEMAKSVGLDSITVRDVAQRAGVNHGLVHRYFGSKAALIDAAVAQLSAELHRGNPEGRTSATTFDMLLRQPEIAQLVARACLDPEPDILRAAAPPRARLDEIVAPIGRALTAAGVTLDPYVANALASAALLGWVFFRPLLKHGFGLPPDADKQLRDALAKLDALLSGF